MKLAVVRVCEGEIGKVSLINGLDQSAVSWRQNSFLKREVVVEIVSILGRFL